MLKSTVSKNKRDYFPALTGLRTVAATMVFLHHYNPFTPNIFGPLIYPFVKEFHVGVTIFFVLSGFLICFRYYDNVSLNREWIRRYFINRFARIYPIYFIITIFSFLPFICKCNFKEQWQLLLLNLSLVRGFFSDYKSTGVTSGWSLTVEEMFYFLFPLIITFKQKIPLFIQAIFFLFLGLFFWKVFSAIDFHGFFSSLKFVFGFTFFGRCVEFFTGIYLALYVKKRKRDLIVQRKSIKTVSGLLYITTCIALLAVNKHYSADSDTFLFFETLLNNFILPPGIALLLYGLLSENTLLSKCLSSHLFVLLGKSSYVFYLIHNGFLFTLFYLTLQIKLPLIFILLQVISILLYTFVEKPLNNVIRKVA